MVDQGLARPAAAEALVEDQEWSRPLCGGRPGGGPGVVYIVIKHPSAREALVEDQGSSTSSSSTLRGGAPGGGPGVV